MFWGRSKAVVAEAPAPGRINDRALLDYEGQRYSTLVEDVANNRVYVAAPFSGDKCVIKDIGAPVVLNIITKNGLHRYSAKVIEVKAESVPLAVLGEFRDMGILQRRQYPRLSETLTVKYRPEMAGKLFAEDWSTSVTIDISAGGLQMKVDPSRIIRVGDILQLEIVIPGISAPVPASCRVVRFSEPGYGRMGLKRMGVAFTKVAPSNKDCIYRYIRRKQADMDAQRRSSERVRLNHSLEMEFSIDNDHGEKRRGLVFEMSVSGLRFSVENITGLDTGAVIEMNIKLFEKRTVAAVGEIIHTSASPNGTGKPYIVSVRCKYLDHKDLEAIVAFLG